MEKQAGHKQNSSRSSAHEGEEYGITGHGDVQPFGPIKGDDPAGALHARSQDGFGDGQPFGPVQGDDPAGALHARSQDGFGDGQPFGPIKGDDPGHRHEEEGKNGHGHAAAGHGGHSHAHVPFTPGEANRAFVWGIALNAAFVVAEFTAGFWSDSLGLISDAGHNLGDVASLILALIAFRMMRSRPSHRYTYGLRKSTVLVSLINALVLMVAVGFILTESIEKLLDPRPVAGGVVAWVAGVGVIINAFSAWLFARGREHDLNLKGAFLHLAADALVSVGVLLSGLLILWTGWWPLDPLIGLMVAGIIVYSTWGLLADSVRLALDGVPASVDYEAVAGVLSSTPGVLGWHHLHIWALSTTETALTAHITPDCMEEVEQVKCRLKQRLRRAGIRHVTLEFETPGARCFEEECDKGYGD